MMRRRFQHSTSASATSSATDTEWSDAEERATHRALVFKKKVDEGAAACARGDFSSALHLYEEAIRLDPTNHVLYTNRSAIFCKLGRYEDALADADKSFSLNPGWTKVFYRKGYALKSMGRHVAALAAYASGLAQDSKNWQLLGGLTECMFQSEMKDRFCHVYEELKYLGLEKSPFVIVSVVGQELLNTGHTADAISILECALRIGTTSLKLRQSVLSALSTAYYNIGDWDKAKRLMEEDLSIALSLGDLLSQARTQGNLGMLSLATNNLTDAVDHYQSQLKIFTQMNATVQRATSLSTLGQIYRRQFRYDESLSNHQRCFEIVQDVNISHDDLDQSIPLLCCQQYGYIGDLYLSMGRLDLAEKYFLDHLESSRCHGLTGEEIKALSELGALDQACSRWEDAAKRYVTALELAKDGRHRQAESSLCCSLSGIYETTGRPELARKWADRALALALSSRDEYAEAKACGHLAVAEMKLGSLENAKKLFRRQLDMATKLGDTTLTMKAYRGLGVCHSSAGDGCLTDAVRCHKAELALAQELGDKFSEATAHGHLGLAYTKLSDHQSAEIHFTRQLALAKQTNNSKLEMMATKNLGFHYADSSLDEEETGLEFAVEYFEKFLMLSQENNDVDAEQVACTNLGRTHFRMGRYKESARYFDQALSLAKDLRDHRAMAKAYGDLGKTRLAMNEFDEALECQKYYLALAHILNDTESKLAALCNIGDVLVKSGKGSVAAKVFAKQLALAKASRRKNQQALAYGQLGKTYDALGKIEKAMALFLQELALYEELNDADGQCQAHGHISEHYLLQGQVEPALKAMEKQLHLAQRDGKTKKEADICKLMGEICAKWNLVNEAIGYFERRRQLLSLDQAQTVTSTSVSCSPRQKASLDYARCLLAAGDDVEAVKALDDVFQFIEHNGASAGLDLPAPEIGVLHRDQGWCWLRLGNYEKAADAFESALDYLERSVVDASVKCDCYRAMAAVELKMGRPQAALAQLNRRLQFARAIGFASEEPKALCDLAYVLCRIGNQHDAKETAEMALSLMNATDADSRLAFRAWMVLAQMGEDYWTQAKRFAMEQDNKDWLISLIILKASHLLPSSTTAAGQLIDQAMDILAETHDSRLIALVRLLSGLRYWSSSRIPEAQDEFLSALRLVDGIHPKPAPGEPTLFDGTSLMCCEQLCLILTFVFFASQKMEEEALVMAEKLRLLNLVDCFRAMGIRRTFGQIAFDRSTLTKLNADLKELKTGVLYFVQVEDVLFSWVLTTGFLMSSAHRIPMSVEQDGDPPTPLLGRLRLRWPFHSALLTDHVKNLIIRACFNERQPGVSQPCHILNRAIKTAMAHDNSAPVVVGCHSIIGCSSKLESSTTPVHQLSFLNIDWADGVAVIDNDGIIVNALGLAYRGLNVDRSEMINGESVPKSDILSKFGRCGWVHIAGNSVDDGAAIQLMIGDGDGDGDDRLTMIDVLNVKLAASVVTINVENTDKRSGHLWNGLSNLAAAFVVSGANAVVLANKAPASFFERFYAKFNFGTGVNEAVNQAYSCMAEKDKPEVMVIGRVDSQFVKKACDGAVALRMLLGTPEECREALRVVLHLIEKALQRINAGMTNSMFTSEQSVKNKAGPEVRGCVEFLLSVGFERGHTTMGHLASNDALYFPQKDSDGKLVNGSGVIQALLGLPQTALFAFSKLITANDLTESSIQVLHLIESLGQRLVVSVGQLESTVDKWLWSVLGVPELLAALGFDRMGESDQDVIVKTIRIELTKKKVALAVTALKAILEDVVTRNPCRGQLTVPTSSTYQPAPRPNFANCTRQNSKKIISQFNSDLAGDLSGLESDFSTADATLKSVVSLAKRCRNSSTSTASGIARKRGKRGSVKRANTGYQSEGEIGKFTSRHETTDQIGLGKCARGYCSDDDGRKQAELELSLTAQVISVDERSSPALSHDGCFADDDKLTGRKLYQHEYARLETPTVCHYSTSSFRPSPPYQTASPSAQSSCLDLTAPSAIRKAMEKINAATRRSDPPPPYGWKNQSPSPPRMPPPYAMHNRAMRPARQGGGLAGY